MQLYRSGVQCLTQQPAVVGFTDEVRADPPQPVAFVISAECEHSTPVCRGEGDPPQDFGDQEKHESQLCKDVSLLETFHEIETHFDDATLKKKTGWNNHVYLSTQMEMENTNNQKIHTKSK